MKSMKTEKIRGMCIDNYIIDDPLVDSTYCLARKATETIAKNKECMVAKWILDNPDRDITEMVLVQQSTSYGWLEVGQVS